MPTYDNLPVYKTSYDLLLAIFNFSQSLTRDYKYTIGDNLKTETVAMITNIYRFQTPKLSLILELKRDLVNTKSLNVDLKGFEPLTPCLQSRCSSQLS